MPRTSNSQPASRPVRGRTGDQSYGGTRRRAASGSRRGNAGMSGSERRGQTTAARRPSRPGNTGGFTERSNRRSRASYAGDDPGYRQDYAGGYRDYGPARREAGDYARSRDQDYRGTSYRRGRDFDLYGAKQYARQGRGGDHPDYGRKYDTHARDHRDSDYRYPQEQYPGPSPEYLRQREYYGGGQMGQSREYRALHDEDRDYRPRAGRSDSAYQRYYAHDEEHHRRGPGGDLADYDEGDDREAGWNRPGSAHRDLGRRSYREYSGSSESDFRNEEGYTGRGESGRENYSGSQRGYRENLHDTNRRRSERY